MHVIGAFFVSKPRRPRETLAGLATLDEPGRSQAGGASLLPRVKYPGTLPGCCLLLSARRHRGQAGLGGDPVQPALGATHKVWLGSIQHTTFVRSIR